MIRDKLASAIHHLLFAVTYAIVGILFGAGTFLVFTFDSMPELDSWHLTEFDYEYDHPAARVDPNIPAPPSRQTQALINMTTNQLLELLTQQTEGSLQRTLTHQLQMLNTDNVRQQLAFELPIKHGNEVDVFDMRIHPDQDGSQQNASKQERPWTIMMAFNLEGLGAIRAQISLVNDHISTHWWAEQQQTVDLFQQHMSTLQDRLSHVGLDVDKVQCQCGVPKVSGEDEVKPQKILYTDINLDEKV